eukprot:4301419-Pyramimonas_sp.AAC.1
MQEARVYSHNGPIICRKRGYILTIGFAAAVKEGLDADIVEWTIKTLLSCLVTLERIQLAHEFHRTAPTTIGLHKVTVKRTIKTLSSHRVNREFNSPANSLRASHVRVKPRHLGRRV